MRNLVLLFMASVFLFAGCENDGNNAIQVPCNYPNYKYYYDDIIDLPEMSNNYILLGIDTSFSEQSIREFISSQFYFDQNYDYKIYKFPQYAFIEIPIRLNSNKTCQEISQIIYELKKYTLIVYAHYCMKTDNCQNYIWEDMGNLCVDSYGSNFYVKVFDENDLSKLNEVALETNTEIIEQMDFMPKWIELRATKKSKGDAIKMANYFHETGYFDVVDYGFSKFPVE